MNVFFVVCNVDGVIIPATQRVWATEEEAHAYAATVHRSYAPLACVATINAGMLWRNIPAPHGDSVEDDYSDEQRYPLHKENF